MTSYRLATYQSADGPRGGIVVGEMLFDSGGLLEISEASTLDIIADWPNSSEIIRNALANNPSPANGLPLSECHLRAPLLWPGAIYCAGMNYSDHAAEMARRMGREPDPNPKASLGAPWHFLKTPRSVADPGATIAATRYCKNLDWEIELAAVIGREAKNVAPENALECVAGYTAANDLSARDLSRRAKADEGSPFRYDWIGQKCFDGSCPMGPWIVPAEDIADPQNLSLKLWVNDRLMQNSNTSAMIFSLAEQIAHISQGMTLYPGDVILTGTPAGVGAGRGEFLKAGDVVTIEIEKIGRLVNTIA